LAGRFGVPLVFKGTQPDRLLVSFSLLATVATMALPVLSLVSAQAFAPLVGAVLVFFAGLGASIVYPAVITLVGRVFPRDQSRVVGFAATGGGVGAFVFPFVMSALSQAWGIRWGFATYGAFAILMTAAALALSVAAARQQKP
jgi:MFS family permease